MKEFSARVFWLMPEQRFNVLMVFSSLGFSKFLQISSELLLLIGKADLDDLFLDGIWFYSPSKVLLMFFYPSTFF